MTKPYFTCIIRSVKKNTLQTFELFRRCFSVNQDRAYICRLIDVYGNVLSERQRDVVDLYYNEDLSLAEISENCGITRQGVRDAIKHAIDTLRSLEASLGFCAKSESISQLAAKISACDDVKEIHRLAESIIGEL